MANDSYIGISIPNYWPAFHFAAHTLSDMFADKRGLRVSIWGTEPAIFFKLFWNSFLSRSVCLWNF
jgi:hypothetical protein